MDFPDDVYEIREHLSCIGYTGRLADVPVLTEEDAELQVTIYPYSDLEEAIFSKATKNDSLLGLNRLAKYLDRHSSMESEFIRNMNVSGFQNLYLKLSKPKMPETDKLVIHAKLARKEYDFTPDVCIVERTIPVSQAEFFNLRNNPLEDNSIIEKYYDDMYCDDDGTRHCLLVYDEKQGDGLLIDAQGADYARYAQYIPYAKLLVEQHEQKMEQTAEPEESPEISGISM